MYHYCTLFNTNYLTRGIAMLESLAKYATDYQIYVLCFDDTTYQILEQRKIPHTILITLDSFEDKELLACKPTRSLGEYCWTCTPALIHYCITHFSLPSCTYVDADLYFFDNPNILIDEMGNSSISLTKHNYTPQYDQSATSGIYCVQFMSFKADTNGLKALLWWRQKCIEWCFARFEDNKFGDQKYLDDWTTRFEGVYVLQNARCGIAPWNVQQFPTLRPIFYHFHNLSFVDKDCVDLGNYKLPKLTISDIYKPYITQLLTLRAQYMPHNFDARKPRAKSWKSPIRYCRRKLRGSYNVFKLTYFKSEV